MDKLKDVAKNIRRSIIKMIYDSQSGHPGGSLSIVEILTSIYFSGECNISKDNINDKTRDRIVISKGHASPAVYATLAELGIISKDELSGFRKIDSHLEGHVSRKVTGVEVSTGPLGQGISFANGMALSSRLDGIDNRVYCILGDGELEEGQIWEAAMTTNQYNLNNVIVFIDYNGIQLDGRIKEIKSPENISEKFTSFGWKSFDIDGHDFEQIINALKEANKSDRPVAIVCKTIKGKGISFMQDNVVWHGKAPNQEEYLLAMKELEG